MSKHWAREDLKMPLEHADSLVELHPSACVAGVSSGKQLVEACSRAIEH
ncbi:hypothetical protein [Mycolicibacterium sp. XJ870]